MFFLNHHWNCAFSFCRVGVMNILMGIGEPTAVCHYPSTKTHPSAPLPIVSPWARICINYFDFQSFKLEGGGGDRCIIAINVITHTCGFNISKRVGWVGSSGTGKMCNASKTLLSTCMPQKAWLKEINGGGGGTLHKPFFLCSPGQPSWANYHP